jgi:hypothetical protein
MRLANKQNPDAAELRVYHFFIIRACTLLCARAGMTVRGYQRYLVTLFMAIPARSSACAPQTCAASTTAVFFAQEHGERAVCLPSGTTARRGKLTVHKLAPCDKHKLALCPVCQPHEYMQRRVFKAVGSALKRMGMQKTQPILTYLGADSWQQVLHLLNAKRDLWNLQNPSTPMTLTNIALDHIRPVHAFSKQGKGAQMLLCNHYTNLQPLLHEDNAWKGDNWSAADEAFWHEHIILKTSFDKVYYPQAAPQQPSLLCPPCPYESLRAPQSEM